MPTRLTTEILAAAIAGFEEQKKRLDARIAELRQQLNGGSPVATQGATPQPTKRRTMSAAARRRIAAAQRKRWANQKAGTRTAVKTKRAAPVKKKRRLSAAGRKAIIEGTKKRWEAFRAAAKKSTKG